MRCNICPHPKQIQKHGRERKKKVLLAWTRLIMSVVAQTRVAAKLLLTSVELEAGGVEFAHVKLQPNDGKHDNGEEEQQADLKQRNHGFHYGLQHHLETWDTGRDGGGGV